MKKDFVYSLFLDDMSKMPDAVSVKGLTIIDNTITPHITQLTDLWKGVPVQVDSVLVMYCTRGALSARVGFEECLLHSNCLCAVIPGSIVEILSVSEDFHCVTMAMDLDFLRLDVSNTLELLKLLKYVQHRPCFELTGNYADRYAANLREAIETLKWTENPLRIKMMQEYIYLMFCCLFPVLERSEKEMLETEQTQQKSLYFKFLELVNAEYRQQRSVAYYAEELGVTPKYLSKVVKAESGTNALRRRLC